MVSSKKEILENGHYENIHEINENTYFFHANCLAAALNKIFCILLFGCKPS